ncbi:hypothetical protein ACFFUP_05445 [Vibrio ostreicida]|uniref:Uncharacterized protein n=1 Tax=Vibrio ostreicida TaxID=526588 RepID=A0ABT8BRT0_9VIBR|nr:hypothetical protein [Vibrio ostreicida]MDN3609522.1 hypothetical protein [Vibrio ostreicida]NPD08401.1 hypothetical protein [Vibrio ostreicida]
MKFSHQPIVAQAECLKSLNRECIYSSLRHVLDVCRDVLDEGTLSSVDSFIKDSNQKKYSSGFLFYIINEIGININSENIDNINLYFNLLGRNIMPNSKIIIGNQDNIDVDLFVLYENINDDVYNFTCIPVSEDKSHTLSEKIVNSLEYINVIDSDLYGEIITIVDEFLYLRLQIYSVMKSSTQEVISINWVQYS